MDSGLTFEDKELQILLTHFTLPEKQKLPLKSKKKKVIVIAGPTAVGKSQIGLIVAKAIGGEIVSADSMQVYRGMDIGTSKPSLNWRREVHHHLIDSRDLDETFNVVEYYQEASQAIKEIIDKGAVPIVVGGDRILYPFSDLRSSRRSSLRSKFKKNARRRDRLKGSRFTL